MALGLPKTEDGVNAESVGTPKFGSPNMHRMRGTDPISQHIQRRIERWFDEDRTRTASELAAKAKTTSATISNIRSGHVGVGLTVLRGLAEAWGTTASELLREAEAKPGERIEYERPRSPAWGDQPGWATAEATARKKFRRFMIPEWAWLAARRIEGMQRPKMTPEFVFGAAQFCLTHLAEEEQ